MEYYLLNIIFIFTLILLSGYFSGSETAFFSIDRHKLNIYKKSNNPRQRLIYKLLSKPNKLLITFLIGNISVNVLASVIFENFTRNISESLFADAQLFSEYIQKVTLGVSIFIMTFLILIFGEIIPKIIAVSANEKFASFSVPILNKFYIIVTPLRNILFIIYNLIRKSLLIKPAETESFRDEDIKTAIDISHKEGQIDLEEVFLFKNIFAFNNYIVKDITITKSKVFMREENTYFFDTLHILKKEHYSRIITYKKNSNNINGVVYLDRIQDIEFVKYKLKDIKHDIIFVPELMPLNRLLKKFVEKNTDMVAVVDEYGEFIGVATLEDILEKIVGQINNPKGFNYNYVEKINDNEFIVNGFCDLSVFNNFFNTEWSDDYSSTIGGFLVSKFGKIPKVNELIRINNFNIIVLSSNSKFISKAKVVKI